MKKILINFPSQTFSNHSIRIINELYKKNRIVIIIDDYYIQPNQKILINKLFKEKKIYDFCIEIIINGKSNYSPSFKKQEVLEKQIEYYKYYYDKYNKISK